MSENSYEKIRNEFLEFYATVRDLSDEEILNVPNDTFNNTYNRLLSLGSIIVDNSLAEKILMNQAFQETANRLIRIHELTEQRLEFDEAKFLRNSSNPLSCFSLLPSYPGYQQAVEMEYLGAELKRGDRVSFLGSGPLPWTPILLYQKHGVESIGIERNLEFAEFSREIVEILGLSKHIQIIHGDHFSLPVSGMSDLILVGYRAEPKTEVFNHLAKKLNIGTRVAYRIPEGESNVKLNLSGLIRRIQLSKDFKGSDFIPSVFVEYRRIRPMPPVDNSLVLTIKSAT